MMRTTLIDSPVANVANIARALRAVGAELEVTSDPAAIRSARKLVLPGVGSFAAAMLWLNETGVSGAVRDAVSSGAALLGICVGHQVLFDASHEMGVTPGLGLMRGEVKMFAGTLPVPQIGWNRVRIRETALFAGIDDETPFYFVNSYAVMGAESETASAEYGGSFTAAARNGSVFGLQFHPEKSSTAGLGVLRNFVEGRFE